MEIPKTVIRKTVVSIITVYHYTFGLMLGPRCRFYPSCSHYARQAIISHGLCYGGYLALCRILRCHPWHPGGIDNIPNSIRNNLQR